MQPRKDGTKYRACRECGGPVHYLQYPNKRVEGRMYCTRCTDKLLDARPERKYKTTPEERAKKRESNKRWRDKNRDPEKARRAALRAEKKAKDPEGYAAEIRNRKRASYERNKRKRAAELEEVLLDNARLRIEIEVLQEEKAQLLADLQRLRRGVAA